jgi:hypothetical protein
VAPALKILLPKIGDKVSVTEAEVLETTIQQRTALKSGINCIIGSKQNLPRETFITDKDSKNTPEFLPQQ